MLRGYRNIILALVGWVALCASSPSGKASDIKQDRTAREISNSLARAANSLEQANEPKRETADCPQGADDRKSNLCAQWKAADAAKQSADATDRTVTIGWIGLVLGTITMVAAIAAAKFARDAAIHTETSALEARRAANVAEAANTIAEQNAVRQLRPYMFPSLASFRMEDNGEPIATIVTKNFGQTPALNVQSWTHSWVEHFPLRDALPDAPADLPKGSAVIGPGATSESMQPHGLPLGDFEKTQIEAGKAALYVYGYGTYIDIFGKEHFYRFVYFASGEGSIKRGRLAAYKSGNLIDPN